MLLRIVSQKKSYCMAEITSITVPSPSRIDPACSIFGECGGCQWQHVSYSTQLEQKYKLFSEAMWRGARVGTDKIRAVTAAPSPYAYRSRVQFKVKIDRDSVCIGFFRTGSHELVEAGEGCPVAVAAINSLLIDLKKCISRFSGVSRITDIAIDAGLHGAAICIFLNGKDSGGTSSFFREAAGELEGCSGLLLVQGGQNQPELVWGSADVLYEMPREDPGDTPFQLSYRSGGFAQINQDQNRNMLPLIRTLGKFSSKDSLLDVYSGNGNFSIPLSPGVAVVAGIEGDAGSILSAMRNVDTNGATNVEFIHDDALWGVRGMRLSGRRFDTVLIDPPRAGAGAVSEEIALLQPGRIIYVSCDPSTLARDCSKFATYGYQVEESVPVDMFSQTFHLESVTVLTRN
ncbi:MAG: RsmD family RNA methyltransferase [Desulfuromonadales bacterium]